MIFIMSRYQCFLFFADYQDVDSVLSCCLPGGLGFCGTKQREEGCRLDNIAAINHSSVYNGLAIVLNWAMDTQGIQKVYKRYQPLKMPV